MLGSCWRYVGSSWTHFWVNLLKLVLCEAMLGILVAFWCNLEVKKAKIGQHRPKMEPQPPKKSEDLGTVAEGGSSPEA